jgi:hypothetical protein
MARSRVFELFDEFAAAWARGEHPSLDDYIQRAGYEGPKLARLVEEYVSRTPVPPPREDAVELLETFLEREPGLLVLRRRRGLRVDEVVDVLANRLRVKNRAKLKARYQELEGGLLDPRRVQATVWDALRAVVGPAAAEAAAWGRPTPPAAPAFRFAQAPMLESAAFSARERVSDDRGVVEPPDEVDRLFGV